MNWGNPSALFLLWLIPVYGLVFYRLRMRRRKALEQLIAPESWSVVLAGVNRSSARRIFLLRSIAVTLCILALARPQWGYRLEEVRSEGLDLMVVLDTSKSMLAADLTPDRFTRARYGIRDLLNQLDGDRIGLLAFAGSSFLQCPLTIDYPAFRLALEDLFIGIIPKGGTAIEQALYKAAEAFDTREQEADRVIILITDGDDHTGDPLRAVDLLKEKNIRVFAVGVGSPEGDLVPVQQQDGSLAFLKDRQGNVVKSTLNEDVLVQLTRATGGMYVRAAPGEFGLERVYHQGLEALQRATHEARTLKIYQDRFQWFLAPALFLLFLEIVVGHRRRFLMDDLYRELRLES